MQHMSTADVARDLERLRQAVGDTQLNSCRLFLWLLYWRNLR